MIAWPADLRPAHGGFSPLVKSLGGGMSLAGFEQVIPQQLDRWQARFTFPLHRREGVLAMRSLLGRLRGRAGTVALPTCETRYAPWRVDQYGRKISPATQRHADLARSPYADAANFRDSLISAHAAETTPAGATAISITMVSGSAPLPGMRFSIRARLYEIETVAQVGSAYQCTIWPTLRFAVAVHTAVDFTSPVCEMRLATDTEGADAMTSLELLKFGSPSLAFEEAAPITDDTPP